MDINKLIKEIEDHFSNISEEELEENLIKAGIEELSNNNKDSNVIKNQELIKLKNFKIECNHCNSSNTIIIKFFNDYYIHCRNFNCHKSESL